MSETHPLDKTKTMKKRSVIEAFGMRNAVSADAPLLEGSTGAVVPALSGVAAEQVVVAVAAYAVVVGAVTVVSAVRGAAAWTQQGDRQSHGLAQADQRVSGSDR